ncbi:CDK5 and ABL1 enzyme substrate 1 (Interactor with CDK3 1) (Ik3-1), partial [Durusdinium trenchii]
MGGNTRFTFVSERESPLVPPRTRTEREQSLLNQGIHDTSRIFLSWNKGYPAMAFSVIKYDEGAESKRRKKIKLSSVIMEMPRRRNEVPKILSDATWLKRREGVSYARYFDAEWAEVSGDKLDPAKRAEDESWDRDYLPETLDDPRIRQGKHRTVQALEGYFVSVLPYTKKKDLKAELNEVFHEQHPDLPAELTLSKIRNLKREALAHAKHLNLELSTIALAITYFEKLIFKGVVSKKNRKLVMSACVVLAYKFNEPPRPDMATLKDLLDDIERVQSLSPKQVLEAEFPVFGHLLFHLNAEKDHVLTHFSRLLKSTESTPTEYLGEDLAEFYFPDHNP